MEYIFEIGLNESSAYNLTFTGDIESCAQLCYYVYSQWCKSFDYFVLPQKCFLSYLSENEVGGTTPYIDTLLEIPYPVDHYELRSHEASLTSMLHVEGIMNITNGNITDQSNQVIFETAVQHLPNQFTQN